MQASSSAVWVIAALFQAASCRGCSRQAVLKLGSGKPSCERERSEKQGALPSSSWQRAVASSLFKVFFGRAGLVEAELLKVGSG